VKGHRASSISRFLAVLVMLRSWLAMTNHCALAMMHRAAAAAPEESLPPCHRKAPAKPQDAPCQDMSQCCTGAKASLAEKVEVKFDASQFHFHAYAVVEMLVAFTSAAAAPAELEHGPPRAISFAELVLQRSVLTHAPPFGV
jgi:hypothetical protein